MHINFILVIHVQVIYTAADDSDDSKVKYTVEMYNQINSC